MKILTQIKMTNSTNGESWRRKTPWTVTTTNSTDSDGETEPNSPLWRREMALIEKMAPSEALMVPNTERGRKMREEKKKRGRRKEKRRKEKK